MPAPFPQQEKIPCEILIHPPTGADAGWYPLIWIIHEGIQGFGISNRAATVRERAVTGRLDIMTNGQVARLLTRAALIGSSSESSHLVHE
jgi:hypothetical protein